LSWWDTPEVRPDLPESDDAAACLRNDRVMSPGNSIWWGPEGLRRGWAVPLFVVMAAAITALLFWIFYLAAHLTPADIITQVVGIGLAFCLAVWRTGSLWWVLGAHAAWNWTQTFVFGCATSGLPATGQWLSCAPSGPAWLSGGATGPEGSILSLPAFALLAWIAVLTLPVSVSGKEALPAEA